MRMLHGLERPTETMVEAMKNIAFDRKEEGIISISRLFGTVGGDIPEHLEQNQKQYNLKIIQSGDLPTLANQWIDQATHGKITDIFSEDLVKVLASAFYFKLNWADQFRKIIHNIKSLLLIATKKYKLQRCLNIFLIKPN